MRAHGGILGRRACAWVVLVLVWLTATCVPAAAATFNSLEVSRDGDIYRLSADVYLDAPLPQVYRVLTDYNHLR
ncbi:MAG: hypothetical protein ACRESQ_08370, partial [Gammaproteobacteria bacterium]